jgi:hypothetical protein
MFSRHTGHMFFTEIHSSTHTTQNLCVCVCGCGCGCVCGCVGVCVREICSSLSSKYICIGHMLLSEMHSSTRV